MYVGSFQAQSDVVWCPYNHDYGNGCDDDGDDDDEDDDEEGDGDVWWAITNLEPSGLFGI